MIVKYKVTDFAKDTGLPVRKILDTLTAIGVKDKKEQLHPGRKGAERPVGPP